MIKTFLHLKEQIANLDIFKVVYENLDHINRIATKFSECSKILVFGTGGSSLGGKCLVNFQSFKTGTDPRVLFIENVDSLSFLNTINKCDPEKTGIIVISKSGRTTETLMLFLTLCEMWKNYDYKNKAIAITELSENNDLRSLAESKNMEVIEHNSRIGGRFSVFSIVGLLPALLGNVDIKAFVKVAQDVISSVTDCKESEIEKCTVFKNSYSMYQDVFKEGKVNQLVIMPYSDILEDYCKWAVQLFSESLGKTENFGITPIKAVGTVDQHSMLQLFLGGPSNKAFNIILAKHNEQTPQIASTLNAGVINHLKDHKINDLMYAHAKATIDVLKEKGKVFIDSFDTFDITSLGYLMMKNFIEVIVIAKLADVNPFNQPAVETSKKIAMKYLDEIK